MFPFNKMRSSLFIVFSLASVYGVLAQPQCGKQAGGAYCAPGFCCNSTGYCGVTDDYCAIPGCQSQCHREECGWQSGGRLCPNDLCCSHDGFCGDTYPWCGPGCQSQCHTPSPPSPAPTPSPGILAECGKQAGGAYCAPGFCCNSTGYCGVTDDYCAIPGCQSQCHREECGWQSGGRLCPNDLCCSHDGFCGDTYPWCGPGCQSQCHTPSPPSPAPTPSLGILAECGKQAGGAYCAPGFCCNSTGYCGVTDDYCAIPGCQSQCHREECGWQSGGRLCPNDLCCSHDGFCGDTYPWCGPGCQSQCHTPPPPSPVPTPSPPTPPTPSPPSPTPSDSVSSIITSAIFEQMFPYRNDGRCQGNGFYTYDAFIAAANSFSGFGTTGDINTRKRELAAFLAQTSHETTGGSGWDAPGGSYAWGYCFVEEIIKGNYCSPSQQWPCAPNKQYYGRGPIQISYNYNYGLAGTAPQINYTLLSDPDAVARDATISFKTAIWFWMTQQPPKPSCHDVITGVWTPSAADSAAGRLTGYGTVTNIINGGVECGKGYITPEEADRIGFYTTYSQTLDVSPGDNLNCSSQQHFGLIKSVVIPESVIA